jgi:hypothetical protein
MPMMAMRLARPTRLVDINRIAALSYIRADGDTEIVRYRLGHDCGTQINPKIVRGMTMGGIAHGIGAALFEEFAYNDEGQLIAQSFMDHEVPQIEIIDHETPSPHTVFGQKVPANPVISARPQRSLMPSTTRSGTLEFP